MDAWRIYIAQGPKSKAQSGREPADLLDTPTGPDRGLSSRLSSPQQRRTVGGLQALTATVGSLRVAADWKVRAPAAGPRCGRRELNGRRREGKWAGQVFGGNLEAL